MLLASSLSAAEDEFPSWTRGGGAITLLLREEEAVDRMVWAVELAARRLSELVILDGGECIASRNAVLADGLQHISMARISPEKALRAYDTNDDKLLLYASAWDRLSYKEVRWMIQFAGCPSVDMC